MTEWYKAAKIDVFLGIRREDIDGILFADVSLFDFFRQYLPALEAHTVREPLTVALRDEGYQDGATPRVLAIEVSACQIDAGLNEIPRATVVTAVGRDGMALAGGASDATASAIVHVIERFLGTTRIPARLYCRVRQTAAAGALDAFDNEPWDGEWVVLFDGHLEGMSRHGSADSASMKLHLTHLLADLSFSSSLTAHSAPGFVPAAMSPLRVPTRSAGVIPFAFTQFGASALAIAGGEAAGTDFWGFQVPGDAGNHPPTVAGLKGFLTLLANQDAFAWENLARADLGANACPLSVEPRRNDEALHALEKIEPKWPNWDGPAAGGAWNLILNGVRAAATAAPNGAGVTRGDLIAQIGRAQYDLVGYRYGVPVSFYITGSVLAALSSGRAFGMDVAGATFADLTAQSFWDLIVGPYSTRYQIAVMPMAGGAVVSPTQPLLDRYWQSIGASEVASWDDDFKTPFPLRGVVLVGDHPSSTGVFPGGNDPSTPGAMARYQQLSAGYDSCEHGVFEFRSMPPWLYNMWRPMEAYGAHTATPRGRSKASVPWTTGAFAAAAVDAVVGSAPGIGLAAAYALSGILKGAADSPPPWATSTASRMAKALFQQEKTRHNSYYVTTRFRYDVAPGSLVKVELPADRFVRAALLDQRNTVATGMVLRMTIAIDCEAESASTSLQVGFVRGERQTSADSKLYANSHPFWSTLCLGVPWCDSQSTRNRLGDGSSIAGAGT